MQRNKQAEKAKQQFAQRNYKENVRSKIEANRQKLFDKKILHYQEKLQALVDLYFEYWNSHEDDEPTLALFNTLDKEWKTLCQFVNSTQSLLTLKHDVFGNNIKALKEEKKNKGSIKIEDEKSEKE